MRYLSVLVHNSVPLIGVLFFDWSVFTLLSLFWFDGLLQTVFDLVRIAGHRRRTNDPAHRTGAPDHSARRFQWISTPPARGTYLSQHARMAFPVLAICAGGLVIAHLVLAKLGIAHDFDLRDFAAGAVAIAVIATIELLIDLRTIGNRSFLWLQIRAGSLGIGLLVLTLLFGIPIAIWFGTVTAAYVVLVVLKIAADCGEVFYDGYKARLWPKGWDVI
jgi:uncharacterized protein DUF6498